MPAPRGEMTVIFIEEIRRTVRRTSYVLILLSVPVLLLALLAIVPAVKAFTEREGAAEQPRPAAIVSLAPEVPLAGEGPAGYVYLSSRAEGIDRLVKGEIRDLFVVPEDYVSSGRVEWVRKGGSLLAGFDPGPDAATGATVEAVLRSSLAAQSLSREVLGRALSPAAFSMVRVDENGSPIPADGADDLAKFFTSFIGGMLLIFSIIAGGSSLLQSVAEEKENRMVEVLLTSARPFTIMAGKVLAIGLSGLFMMAVWVGSILAILPRVFELIPGSPTVPIDAGTAAWVLAFYVAGYFISGILLAAMGAATTGVKEANQMSTIVILPMVAPMWFLAPIVSEPNGVLARALSFFPMTAPMTAMLRLAAEPPSVLELGASLAIMVVSSIGLLWLAARIFRAGILMYGQRMTLRRFTRALKEAG
ncbi:MAG: ABC transporter permease [SAR202 cluster bacterium]|nr:ABC transporter permease [SAR202 cluster bacterium]